MAKLVLLPGIERGYPVFDRVQPLLPDAEVLHYPVPSGKPSIASMATQLADAISPESVLVGISFGGIVAQELASQLSPKGCVIISSVRSPKQFPFWMWIGKLIGGSNACRLLERYASWIRAVPGLRNTRVSRVAQQQFGPCSNWRRWATSAILSWQPTSIDNTPIFQIHGSEDRTFPLRFTSPDLVIRGGKHALTVSHPQETANEIKQFVRGL